MYTSKTSGPKLGELLEIRGRIDRELIFKALRAQRAAGGRLGTCLIELGAVSEEDLLHVLSDQLRVPFLGADDLRTIDADVLAIVPAKIAEKRRAIPVRASKTQLTVAMLDPQDLASLDELAFVSGRRVRPHVTSELRLMEALGRHYKVDIPSRFVKLLDRVNRASLWARETSPEADGSEGHAVPSWSTPPPPPELRGPEPARPAATPPAAKPAATPPQAPLATAPSPALAPAPARVEAPAVLAAPTPASAEEVERQLAEATDRDSIGGLLLDYARGHASRSILLKLQQKLAAGWMGTVPPLTSDAVTAYSLPMNVPSVVRALHDGAPLFRGPLPQLGAHRELRTLLDADRARDLLALPLRVRGHLAAVWILTADESLLPAAVVEEAQRLAARAAMALEMLILRHKLKQT